jgi:hypothetical protein
MAVTWAASAPHATAVKEVQKAGIGSGYGSSGSSVFEVLKWPGNKRAVLTKLTATGTYTTGGDAIDESLLGLKEVHAAFIVASATANVRPIVDGQDTAGVPTVLCTTSTAPKVQYFDDDVEATAGVTLTGDVFHVILVGI